MSKITESARGEECQVRLPGICSFNNEETVAGHLGGAGTANKQPDLFISYICYPCHAVVDGHVKVDDKLGDKVKLYFLEGMVRTQQILLDKGLIPIK